MGLFGAIGGVIGSMIGARSAKKGQARDQDFQQGLINQARKRFVSDRTNERNYLAGVTARDRQYLEGLTARDRKYNQGIVASDRRYTENLVDSDRRYAERMLFGERDYARKLTTENRAYDERMLGADRKYAEKVYQTERRDLAASKAADAASYRADRARMQALADKQAIRTTASRGIDFARLRDDAVKAGFNPLTAMQWASAYNTETGFGVMGDAYSGSASSPSHVIPGRPSGGPVAASGGAPGGTPAVGSSASFTTAQGSVVPGSNGFSTPGGGYGSSGLPSFMSADLGSSIGDLIDTGLNWFNHKDDAKYQAIADQVARGQLAREYERQTPRNFGYSLSKIEPFRPAVSVAVPPLRPDGTELVASGGFRITPRPDGRSSLDDWNDAYGGEVADVAGGVNAASDYFAKEWEKPWFKRTGGGALGAVDWARRRFGPQVPAGTASYSLTGSTPYAPLMNAYGGW